MAKHLIFLLLVLSFLSGVIFSSLGLSFLFSFLLALILLVILLIFGVNIKITLFSALLIISGSFYYLWDNNNYHALLMQLPTTGKIQGMIVNDPKRDFVSQSFYLKTDFGKILVQNDARKNYFYGNTIIADGKIEKPPQNYYGQYLAKEGVVGIMRGARINRINSGEGNPVLASLFYIKERVRTSFGKLLTNNDAALLSGITLGANEDISKQFLKNLSLSGVRHITAINGLHMSILFFMIFSLCIYALPRRYAFIITVTIIFLFTALTGFTISAIRAALMAFIAGLARQVGRLHTAPHNALALAALILTLANPKVLVFDIGFQLSFLAVFAIIYLVPILRSILHIGSASGFLAWKETLLITLSAQLMTAPILITQFQSFSITAFIANILIVTILPLIMALGFLIGFFSFFIYPLALLLSFVVAPLLEYVTFVVNLFAKAAILFNPSLGFIGIIIYYGVLFFTMHWFYSQPRIMAAAKK